MWNVLRNVDELFELRPPAAMSTAKKGGVVHIPHGKRLEPSSCYVNTGTMVVAHCAELFQLLVADVQEADPQWHRGGWSPEQHYLFGVLAGEYSHVSQLHNFEAQLHSGVPLSDIWKLLWSMRSPLHTSQVRVKYGM